MYVCVCVRVIPHTGISFIMASPKVDIGEKNAFCFQESFRVHGLALARTHAHTPPRTHTHTQTNENIRGTARLQTNTLRTQLERNLCILYVAVCIAERSNIMQKVEIKLVCNARGNVLRGMKKGASVVTSFFVVYLPQGYLVMTATRRVARRVAHAHVRGQMLIIEMIFF